MYAKISFISFSRAIVLTSFQNSPLSIPSLGMNECCCILPGASVPSKSYAIAILCSFLAIIDIVYYLHFDFIFQPQFPRQQLLHQPLLLLFQLLCFGFEQLDFFIGGLQDLCNGGLFFDSW